MLRVNVQLSGGLELLFDRVKEHQLDLDPAVHGEPDAAIPDRHVTIRALIRYLREHRLRERPELFVQDDSVRPGILVLVNDCDWELCDGLQYRCQDGDTIVFISTLHGG